MRQLIISAMLVLGLTLATVGQGNAWEPTEYERRVDADYRQQQAQIQTQNDLAAQQSRQRQQQEFDRANDPANRFNPQAFNGPAPYNLFQNGRTSVCRRGFNNSLTCN